MKLLLMLINEYEQLFVQLCVCCFWAVAPPFTQLFIIFGGRECTGFVFPFINNNHISRSSCVKLISGEKYQHYFIIVLFIIVFSNLFFHCLFCLQVSDTEIIINTKNGKKSSQKPKWRR